MDQRIDDARRAVYQADRNALRNYEASYIRSHAGDAEGAAEADARYRYWWSQKRDRERELQRLLDASRR